MRLNRRSTMLAAVPLMAFATVVAAPSASAEPPRPGCGYGDSNHSHQAAPGQDPMGLRPGAGNGDTNNMHTAPPGQAPDDGGVQGSPRRGCADSPLS